MNTKNMFLSLFVTLSVGLINADETSANAMRLMKNNVEQLFNLQKGDPKDNPLMVEAEEEMKLNAELHMRLMVAYKKCDCEVEGSCDQLPSALAAYKESCIKLDRLAKEEIETCHKPMMEFISKL